MKLRAVPRFAFCLVLILSGFAGAGGTAARAAEATNLNTTLTERDIARILPKMNRVWAQAGVHFYLESLVREEAAGQDGHAERARTNEPPALLTLRPEASRDSNCFHIYYLHRCQPNGIYIGPGGIFVKDTASLRKVAGGIDEPLPRVSSHELGHAFTLEHRQNVTNLMASGTTGTWLNDAEIKQARAAPRKQPWIQRAADVLKRADQLAAEKKDPEARALYERLVAMPVVGIEVARARKMASQSKGKAE